MSHDYFTRGAGPVGVRTIEVHDAGRAGRSLPVELWYPAAEQHRGADLDDTTRDRFEVAPGVPEQLQSALRDAAPGSGRFPLVVFSHGAVSHRRSSSELASHLASHGFVVASADHVGNTMGDLFHDLAGGRERGETRLGTVEQSAVDRPADVAALLDAIVGGVDPEIAAVVDGQAIGTCGVSFGGWTSLAFNQIDARPRACFPIVPAWGKGPLKTEGLSDRVDLSAWGRAVPTFVLAAERDALILLASVRGLYEQLVEPKRLGVLRNAGHVHFVDHAEERHEELRKMWLSGLMPVDDPDIDFAQIAEDARPFSELCPAEHGSDVVRGLCLAHMQAHLKGDGEAADWLASDLGAVFDQRGIALAVE